MKPTNPISVCLICLTRRGGLVNYNLHLANALAEQMQVSTIVSHTTPVEHFNPAVVCKTIFLGNHGARSTLLRLPAGLLKFFKTVKSLPADVYHITSDQEWNLFIGLVLRAMGKRLVYTVHDPKPHLGASWHNVVLEQLFRRLPQAYIVLSKYCFEQLSTLGIPEDKIAAVRLGDLSLQEVEPFPPGENVILFQGRLEPYKGLDILLEAANKVLPSFPDWKLVIAGTGRLVPTLPVHPQIEFLHRFISDEEIVDLHRRSGFLVLPYIEATQSAIPVLAMAAGRPVIATRAGGLPEYVQHEHTGLLVPPGDPAALGEAMQRLMEDGALRTRLGQNAAEVYRHNFNWNKIAFAYAEAYKKRLY